MKVNESSKINFHNYNYFSFLENHSITDIDKADSKLFNKKSIRYAKNQLKKIGELSFELIDSKQVAKNYLPEFSNMHTIQWENSGNAIFLNKRNYNFYQKIIDKMFDKGKVHFSFLKLDDEIIAFHFGFLNLGTFYYYKPTFKKEYFKYGAGSILNSDLVKYAIENNYRYIDFGGGEEFYKNRFANKTDVSRTVYLTKKFSVIIFLMRVIEKFRNFYVK